MSERDETVQDAATRAATHISELIASTAIRLAHSPYSAVTLEEQAAFTRLVGALEELAGHAHDAGYRKAVSLYAEYRSERRDPPAAVIPSTHRSTE